MQHSLQTLLPDIANPANIADDNIVFGKSDDEHDDGLIKVLKGLTENIITLTIEKCEFDKKSIEYYGYISSKDIMKPSPNKIDALKTEVHPIDTKSVQSFLGLTNYLKLCIPSYSTLTYRLHTLTKKTETSFGLVTVKKHLIPWRPFRLLIPLSNISMKKKTVMLYCDASPVGISVISLQQIDGEDPNVVDYSSRS